MLVIDMHSLLRCIRTVSIHFRLWLVRPVTPVNALLSNDCANRTAPLLNWSRRLKGLDTIILFWKLSVVSLCWRCLTLVLNWFVLTGMTVLLEWCVRYCGTCVALIPRPVRIVTILRARLSVCRVILCNSGKLTDLFREGRLDTTSLTSTTRHERLPAAVLRSSVVKLNDLVSLCVLDLSLFLWRR